MEHEKTPNGKPLGVNRKALKCKHLKKWAEAGLNRRHRDFQSHYTIRRIYLATQVLTAIPSVLEMGKRRKIRRISARKSHY